MADTIDINGDTIMRQAMLSAHDYLMHAIDDVPKGAGHTELVAAYVVASAIDYGATTIAQQIRAGLDGIADAIREGKG